MEKVEEKNEVGPMMSERAYGVFESRGLNGQEAKIEEIKNKAAQLWDLFDNIPVPPGLQTDAMRLVSIAKTNLETSVMYAVKAYSRNH